MSINQKFDRAACEQAIQRASCMMDTEELLLSHRRLRDALQGARDEIDRLTDTLALVNMKRATLDLSDPTDLMEQIQLWHEWKARAEAAESSLHALRQELEEEKRAGDLHRKINQDVSDALGQSFGESWHDLGAKVTAVSPSPTPGESR